MDHSTAGAQEAWVRQHLHTAFAVAGHHSGLPDGGSPADDPGDATLFGRSKKPVAPYDGWQEVTLPASTPPAWACADPLSLAFFTRMLYSCLVDADFIDTETFMDGKAAPRGSGTDIAALRDIVSAQAQRYLRPSRPRPSASSATPSSAPASRKARTAHRGSTPSPYPPAAARPSPPSPLRWSTPPPRR